MKLSHLTLPALAVVLLGSLPALQAEPKVFFGNLHSHTSYSDGSGTPSEAYRYAKEVAHLDVLAITEHNHAAAETGADERRDGLLIAKTPALYNGPTEKSVIGAAKKWNKDGEFVALYGQEFSTISSGNHVNVFEVPKVITVPNGRFDQLATWLGKTKDSQGKPPIVQFNHPWPMSQGGNKEYGRDDFPTLPQWLDRFGKYACTIELLNGPGTVRPEPAGPGVWRLVKPGEKFEEQWFKYLGWGFHLAPSADQDNHYQNWGTMTDARTGIICEHLTKAEVLDAIRARHVYATADKNLRLIVKLGNALAGDIIPKPTEAKLSVSIADDDEPAASYRIQVYGAKTDGIRGSFVRAYKFDGNGTVQLPALPVAPFDFILVKVSQAQGERSHEEAWSAPFWFK